MIVSRSRTARYPVNKFGLGLGTPMHYPNSTNGLIGPNQEQECHATRSLGRQNCGHPAGH